MDERKIMFVWYDRLEEMNKGVLRILALVSFIAVVGTVLSVIVGAVLAIINGDFEGENLELIILVGGMFFAVTVAGSYWLFWQIVRVILWIYDGFKKAD